MSLFDVKVKRERATTGGRTSGTDTIRVEASNESSARKIAVDKAKNKTSLSDEYKYSVESIKRK